MAFGFETLVVGPRRCCTRGLRLTRCPRMIAAAAEMKQGRVSIAEALPVPMVPLLLRLSRHLSRSCRRSCPPLCRTGRPQRSTSAQPRSNKNCLVRVHPRAPPPSLLHSIATPIPRQPSGGAPRASGHLISPLLGNLRTPLNSARNGSATLLARKNKSKTFFPPAQ
ncbi:hypothetical protein L1887_56461 [Cichorium endivia]|nr:hypothetical protein L1887_56461 [Cichorium endivia]